MFATGVMWSVWVRTKVMSHGPALPTRVSRHHPTDMYRGARATGKALRENGLGDGEYVETVAGGLGSNSEAPIDRMYDMATEDKSGVDDGTMSRVPLPPCRSLSRLFFRQSHPCQTLPPTLFAGNTDLCLRPVKTAYTGYNT